MQTKKDGTLSEPPSPTTKKSKLTIHISTKKRKQEKENKIDETTAAVDEPEKKLEENDSKTKVETKVSPPCDDTDQEGTKEIFSEEAKEPPMAKPKPEENKEEESAAITSLSPRSDGDKSDKPPPSSTASSANPSPVPPLEDAGDDVGNRFPMARSGRKAAKLAAAKIAEKKPRKQAKKKEEDPWVQCDRCHKWRHLPATVNLGSLPEHWFCEMNTYDAKRNNCEASEQTPKEVAKEKKRMKKLALKKLQIEEAQAAAAAAEDDAAKHKGKKRVRRASSPKNYNEEKETEFVVTEDKASESGGDSPKPDHLKKKRGRPRNADKEKDNKTTTTKSSRKGSDEPKQEWVQCEKCEKWRRLPPRISAADLPDVWYCAMNTWDINMATCTAVEDKHELSPSRPAQYNEQSQIPTGFSSGSKLSYRNLIFGNGRLKKSISERMRAQESLFSSQREEEADMSMPPIVMYANSNVFYNKSIRKSNSYESDGAPPQPSILEIASHSRVWQELNNNASLFHAQNTAAYNSVGIDKYCNPNSSLNQEAIDTLKAMSYCSLGNKTLSPHEILLETQVSNWNNVPFHWMELRSLCTIEIMSFILDELVKDGLLDVICDTKSLTLENTFYLRRIEGSTLLTVKEIIEQRSSCLKIRKPWK